MSEADWACTCRGQHVFSSTLERVLKARVVFAAVGKGWQRSGVSVRQSGWLLGGGRQQSCGKEASRTAVTAPAGGSQAHLSTAADAVCKCAGYPREACHRHEGHRPHGLAWPGGHILPVLPKTVAGSATKPLPASGRPNLSAMQRGRQSDARTCHAGHVVMQWRSYRLFPRCARPLSSAAIIC